MNNSWYKKYLPTVKIAKKHLPRLNKALRSYDNIDKVYIWGSYAVHCKQDNFHIKDLDALILTPICPEDLLSVSEKILAYADNNVYLEEQGYNPAAVKLSHNLVQLSQNFPIPVDWWAISNHKLLHWGPILPSIQETEALNKKAEHYAEANVGKSQKEIVTHKDKSRWYRHYQDYLSDFFSDMPTGWYLSKEDNTQKILKNCIKRLPKA